MVMGRPQSRHDHPGYDALSRRIVAKPNERGKHMVHQNLSQDTQGERRRGPCAEAVFKPLALPALAAAVHSTRPQPRRAPQQELPPSPRKDAVTD